MTADWWSMQQSMQLIQIRICQIKKQHQPQSYTLPCCMLFYFLIANWAQQKLYFEKHLNLDIMQKINNYNLSFELSY